MIKWTNAELSLKYSIIENYSPLILVIFSGAPLKLQKLLIYRNSQNTMKLGDSLIQRNLTLRMLRCMPTYMEMIEKIISGKNHSNLLMENAPDLKWNM